jgi:glycosyltransferase involved in cell wall biosynthesis
VVAPRAGTIARLVEREGVGVTFEPGQGRLLGEALARLGDNPERLARYRARAREVALERYNAESQRPALLASWGL